MRAVALILLMLTSSCGEHRDNDAGINPDPVVLLRPHVAPLSAAASVGALIFRDTTLSASGRVACATCHDPAHAYAPSNALAAQLAGPHGTDEGKRAVLSLRYAVEAPNFTIGPDRGDDIPVDLHARAAAAQHITRVTKIAGAATDPAALVPQGGLFWDGRANTLQDQAMGPIFDPAEMANHDLETVAARLRHAPYYRQLQTLFGAGALRAPAQLVDEAMFAVARYEVEDPTFHPYSSKYDRYLEGKVTLTAAEARGLRAFEDTKRGNCAGCHLDRPSPDGRPPAFTDYQFEALGVPRNRALVINRDSTWYDLGACGPIRTGLTSETQYCGMFRTPSLRNVATRKVFFHNGVYHTLDDVLAFYDFRDVRPDSIYRAPGHRKFDDLPLRFSGNVDTADAPFNHHRGDKPPMTEQEMRDIVAFLRTLTDN